MKISAYPFTHSNFQQYKNTQGIYALIFNKQIIYVGQSTNLAHRLNAHWKAEYAYEKTLQKIQQENGTVYRDKQLALYTFIKQHKDELYFTVLEETTDLDNREKFFIEYFLPRFNYKGVDIPF